MLVQYFISPQPETDFTLLNLSEVEHNFIGLLNYFITTNMYLYKTS